MKIVYCLNNYSTGGGVERIVALKSNYLTTNLNDEVYIISTEKESENNFYNFHSGIKLINLNINFQEDKNKPFLQKLMGRLQKKRLYKQRLSAQLYQIKPDITISTFWHEFSFLHKIKDGSKKIVEFHFTRYYKLLEKKNPSLFDKLILSIVHLGEVITVKKYDKFVVLTEKDKKIWGNLKNSVVINNMVTDFSESMADVTVKRAITAGRLTHQKGFDYIIDIWKDISLRFPDWKLDIYGNGEDKDDLQRQIDNNNLTQYITIVPATNKIFDEYLKSSIYVMTSRYEGLPMVLIEAMSLGMPIVAYDCECGPSELIEDGENGYIIPFLDKKLFVEQLSKVMGDEGLRKTMGQKSIKLIERLNDKKVMEKWISVFNELKK